MWMVLENMTLGSETKCPTQWHGDRGVKKEVVTLVNGCPL